MTRWYYAGGAAHIVVLQRNSLRTRKSTGAPTAANATSVSHARRGSGVTKIQTKHSEESQIKNFGN